MWVASRGEMPKKPASKPLTSPRLPAAKVMLVPGCWRSGCWKAAWLQRSSATRVTRSFSACRSCQNVSGVVPGKRWAAPIMATRRVMLAPAGDGEASRFFPWAWADVLPGISGSSGGGVLSIGEDSLQQLDTQSADIAGLRVAGALGTPRRPDQVIGCAGGVPQLAIDL